MAQLVSLELILLLGVTIFGGLLYLLISSYRNRRDDDEEDPSRPDPGESEEDRAWRAKRFWWFGR